MDRRELEEIERFLGQVGRPSLYAYYGLDPADAPPVVEEAVRKRRSWAQGQQSNPKYKGEALFLIKNNALVRRALLEDADAYRAYVRDDSTQRNLDVLSLFIKGTVASGLLTPGAEAAIRHQGKQLDLSETAIMRRVDEILAEVGARRDVYVEDDLSTEALAVDHYAILGITNRASVAEVEEAYRARYRWARNLKDLKRSSDILQALDEAWRVLSEPGRRARYDKRRAEILAVADGVERNYNTILGLLSGPEDAITGEAPLPGAPVPTIHEVGFPARTETPPAIQLPHAAPTDPAVPRAPTPPPLTGRTIGLAEGPQSVGTMGPRLLVDGPESVTLNRGRTSQTWVLRNGGQGKMPGRVTSDRDWIQVEPARLDPSATKQEVVARLVPRLQPWGHSSGTITIATDHGERRVMTLHAHRRSWLPIAAAGLLLGLGALALLALVLLWPAAEKLDAGKAGLDLVVDPVADRVLVDGVMAGYGRTLFIPQTSTSFVLRVEADGFAPHEEIVAVAKGERSARSVELKLVDPMTWSPPDTEAVPAPAAVVASVEALAPRLLPCFDGVAGDVSAEYSAWLTGDGQVRKLDVAGASFPVETTLPCLQRVFRGLRTARFEGGHTVVTAKLDPRTPP